jgi:hypothetical protein
MEFLGIHWIHILTDFRNFSVHSHYAFRPYWPVILFDFHFTVTFAVRFLILRCNFCLMIASLAVGSWWFRLVSWFMFHYHYKSCEAIKLGTLYFFCLLSFYLSLSRWTESYATTYNSKRQRSDFTEIRCQLLSLYCTGDRWNKCEWSSLKN